MIRLAILTVLATSCVSAQGVAPFVMGPTVQPIALVSTSDSTQYSGAGKTSFSFLHTIPVGTSLMMIYNHVYFGTAVVNFDSVKWGSQKATMIADTGGATRYYFDAAFYLVNPTSGSDTVKFFYNQACTYSSAGITGWTNTNTVTPVGPYSIFYSTADVDSIILTVSGAVGDVIWCGVGYRSTSDVSSYGTGQTEAWRTSTGAGTLPTAGSYKAGAASVQMITRFDASSTYRFAIGVAIKP